MIRRFNRSIRCINYVRGARAYHSYPDPSEKPVISSNQAPREGKLIDKTTGLFSLHEKFRLDKQFPDMPPVKPLRSNESPPTLSTKLDNGLTVASQEMSGLMSSIAFVVKTGSGHELASNRGCTHFLELNAFRSTLTKTHQQLVEEVERLGGMIQCIANREQILYAIDVLRPNVPQALDILADTILLPTFPEDELEKTRLIVKLQKDELPSEVFSKDLVQQAAYLQEPLGNPHFCPEDKANHVTASLLNEFRAKYFVGENCVISASAVDHEEFVSLVKSRFQSLPKGDANKLLMPSSPYTGGLITEQRKLKEPFVKLALAFEVGGWRSDTLIPTCVLQQLLGGGKSFSAGGPGKGMYTRLYTQVLNRYHWAESVESFVQIFDESGLLGIDGACPPEYVPNMISTIIDQFCNLAHNEITAEELNRAKNMLKSSLMMQLESRLIVCEDIVRQFATYGKRDKPQEICNKIDAVTAKDLSNVAALMLEKPPAVACVGYDISQVSPYDLIRKFTQQYNHDVWKNAQKRQKK